MNQINKVNYKEEDAFCNLISAFRTSLDQLNTVFIDLIGYHKEMKDTCTSIAKINNECIRKFLFPADKSYNLLIHQNSIYIIENYLNEEESKAPKLLNKINEEIKEKFEAFLKSPESPYKIENNQSKILNKKLDKFKEAIKETQYLSGIIDDYFDDVSSIFQRSFDKNYNDNDDDDDDNASSRNDRRFYGDIYPVIPKAVQNSIRQFMTYVNSQILIRNILNSDKSISKCYEKLKIPRPVVVNYKEAYEQLLIENQNLKQQIKDFENEKESFNKQNKKKDKQIKILEEKYKEADGQVRELKIKINELTRQLTKAKPARVAFVPKDDDKYLDAVSYFRRAIDNMNSCFMDLAKYDKNFQTECKTICHINNQFINDITNDDTSDLTHFARLNDVYRYYANKGDNEKDEKTNICVLLINLKQKIERRFKYFKPFKVSFISITREQNEGIRKRLKEKRNSINKLKFTTYNDPDTDFMTEKIEPLFANHEDDDDSDNYDEKYDHRYFGNPYPNVPKFVQEKVNQFLAYANSLVAITSVLEFDKYVDSKIENVSNKNQKKQISLMNELFAKFKAMAQEVEPKIDLFEEGLNISEKIFNMHNGLLHNTLRRSKSSPNSTE